VEVVATGVFPSGETWAISAGRDGTGLYTFLDIIDRDGRSIGGGGFGGDLFVSGHLMNCLVRRPETKDLQYVGRADPRIERIRFTLSSGATVTTATVGYPARFGVTFFCALLPRDDDVIAIDAFAGDGTTVDRLHA
jgi:hypothetical protein